MPHEIPFAVANDIVDRYGPIPNDQESRVTALLVDASQKLVDELPAAVARAPYRTLTRIVCRMVWEALDHGTGTPAGVESAQFGVGVFQESYKYANPSSRLFITKEDRRALRGGQRAFSIDLLVAAPDPGPGGPL